MYRKSKHYIMNLRIKEVIKGKGMTITELADKMGINRVNLSNMVNGNPTVETLNKIADAIGCPVTELFEKPQSDGFSITSVSYTHLTLPTTPYV